MRDATMHLNGVDLRFDTYGPDAAAVVVLLHALGESAHDWQRVAEALAETFRVIVPDARGHGGSGTAEAYSFELMRDDTLALLDHLDVRRTAIIGHSMGGTVAYLVAETRPAMVCCLAIEDTPVPRGADLPEPPAEAPDDVAFDWSLVGPIMRQLNQPDPAWWDDLRVISASVLVIGGGPDSTLDQAQLRDVCAAIPGARFVSIGGGHYVHATKPAEYIALVASFLAAHRAHSAIERDSGDA